MSQTETEQIKDAIRKHFTHDRHPEHVEESLQPLLEIIQAEVGLTPEEWEEVFGRLRDSVEFREAGWLEDQP